MGRTAPRPASALAVHRHDVGLAFAQTLTQAVKQAENSAGSSAFSTSLSVSWEGMPRANGSMVRKKGSFSRPQRQISTKFSPIDSVPHSTSSMISASG